MSDNYVPNLVFEQKLIYFCTFTSNSVIEFNIQIKKNKSNSMVLRRLRHFSFHNFFQCLFLSLNNYQTLAQVVTKYQK